MTQQRGWRSEISRLGAWAGFAAAAVCALDCGQLAAQTYPDRPIKIIVPFGAGGPPDVAARIVGDYLSPRLGAIVVENRPGAGGTIAAKAVAGMAPDGYSLLLATSGALSIGAQLYRNAGYDPVTSFAPISLISMAPLVLGVNAQLPIHSIAELVAYAKANPDKLNYGSSMGTPPHISGEMFKIITGVKIVHVPYKSASAASSDVIAGQIQITFEGTTGILPFLRSGKMRALGVSSPHRLPELPDVPTMIEQGINGMPPDAWQGVVAPAGTPQPLVVRLNQVINQGLSDPGVKAKITNLGGAPKLTTPAEFVAFLVEMKEEWGKVLKVTGVRIE